MNLPNTSSDITDLRDFALEKIDFGETLVQSLDKFSHLEGIQKLLRKITQELNFLKKISKTEKLKKEHLQCTNLTHFSAVIDTIDKVKKCVSVNKIVMLGDRKITIDIVCDDGLTWVKVIARNPKSLSQICMGDASYGVRSIIDQAEDYVEAAKLYPCLFQIPKVIFVFFNGVGNNLAAKIEKFGITVDGIRIKDVDIDEDDENPEDRENFKISENTISLELSTPNISHITRVNLDVSAMLAYVSSVTNGSADLYEFSVHVLAQQAKWEQQKPLKPILDHFFKDKKLYCCQTAVDSFINIVNTVGGPNEKKRSEELLKRITVLPDNATADCITDNNDTDELFKHVQFSSDKKLSIGGKIRERSLTIFTFGDRIGAVTVTSNDGFVRSAKQQGINFVVFVHESRALTEQKEQMKGVVKC